MSTLQSSAHGSHQPRMRSGARLVALGTLIVIGAIALVIAVASAGHSGTTSRPIPRAQAGVHTPREAYIPASFTGFYEDPTTHAVKRVRTTNRHSWPSLTTVLAPLTPEQRQYVLGIAALSEAQVAAAFGTGR